MTVYILLHFNIHIHIHFQHLCVFYAYITTGISAEKGIKERNSLSENENSVIIYLNSCDFHGTQKETFSIMSWVIFCILGHQIVFFFWFNLLNYFLF